jgi:hypothetical protein
MNIYQSITIATSVVQCSSSHKSFHLTLPSHFKSLSFLASDDTTSSAIPESSSNLPQNQSLDILPSGSKFELPLWAAIPLAFHQKVSLIDINLPRHYREAFRKKLKAGAEGYDIRSKSSSFYEAGALLCSKISKIRTRGRGTAEIELLRKEAVELRAVLKTSYIGERLRRTLDWCLNSRNEDVTAFTRKLADFEKRLFDAGARASLSHHMWKNNGSKRIVVSNISKSNTGGGGGEKRIISPEGVEDQAKKMKSN